MYTSTVFDNSFRTASEINTAMGRVYGHMSLAVLTSMIVSFLVGTSPALLTFFFTGALKWVVIFAPLIAIFGISFAMDKVSKTGAQLMLHGFAALMGLSFATIFAIYTMSSVVSAFMSAAILFAVMSGYGYFTKQSLDSFGKWLFVGLITICISSIINIFIGNSTFQMVISALATLIFLGITAYDTQKIREILVYENDGVAEVRGALTLYLDFINLFINLLQLFGGKKE